MLRRAQVVWGETPALTKKLCTIMPPLGCLLTVLGILGDNHGWGWWENRSFLTNLVSSFTGLMFAVPFALLVLSRLGEAHDLIAEQRATQRHSERVLRDFHDAWSVMEETVGTLNDLVASHNPYFLRGARRGQIIFLREVANEFRTASDESLRAMKEHWQFLRDEVRPRRVEVGLHWNFSQMLLFEESFSKFCDVYEQMRGRIQQIGPPSVDRHVLFELSNGFHEMRRNATVNWGTREGEYPTFGI